MGFAAELPALLAELREVAERWGRGVGYLDAGGDRDKARRIFESLADRAGELAEQIDVIEPGAADELLGIIFGTDEAGMCAMAHT